MEDDLAYPLIKQIATICRQNNRKIVTAESCTGGRLAEIMSHLPGSSSWFDCGFVPYSNTAKQKQLGVLEEILDRYGAVSEPVAKAMAEGALLHSQAYYSIAVTGIAGPDGGCTNKPIGTVCFAWANRDPLPTSTVTKHLRGDRKTIREQVCQLALQGWLDRLKEGL